MQYLDTYIAIETSHAKVHATQILALQKPKY